MELKPLPFPSQSNLFLGGKNLAEPFASMPIAQELHQEGLLATFKGQDPNVVLARASKSFCAWWARHCGICGDKTSLGQAHLRGLPTYLPNHRFGETFVCRACTVQCLEAVNLVAETVPMYRIVDKNKRWVFYQQYEAEGKDVGRYANLTFTACMSYIWQGDATRLRAIYKSRNSVSGLYFLPPTAPSSSSSSSSRSQRLKRRNGVLKSDKSDDEDYVPTRSIKRKVSPSSSSSSNSSGAASGAPAPAAAPVFPALPAAARPLMHMPVSLPTPVESRARVIDLTFDD